MSTPVVDPLPEGAWSGSVATTASVATVAPSGLPGLLVRGVVALALLIGWVQVYASPVERDLSDLYGALEAGQVTSVTIERPREVWSDGQGTFAVRWSGAGRPGSSTYRYEVSSDPAVTAVDQGEVIASLAAQSPQQVDVTWHAGPLPTGHVPLLGPLGVLGGLLVLVLGPQPRLATRWAWFWLATITPVWLAFVVLEPVPLWRRVPAPSRPGRLTGGWAFVLVLVLNPLLTAFVPGYADLW
ncbi:hypothetical protein [Cellulomonas soli]|uniref:Uncharacterized protein n=1 Tax=Cellulomonas soli TaxID=931535 RepID=A0A512PAS7_9CELL|nr:hypothetical protein [Cellulomonas soli]NYI57405.1 hypothetical protein [Cellulomonas soli]GEP68314.1 hypothetical protein CSO01_10290 [Cellulomonas soli]